MTKKSRAQRARERPCQVCFGSHGCKKQEGHSGEHYCECGMPASGFRELIMNDGVISNPGYVAAESGGDE